MILFRGTRVTWYVIVTVQLGHKTLTYKDDIYIHGRILLLRRIRILHDDTTLGSAVLNSEFKYSLNHSPFFGTYIDECKL